MKTATSFASLIDSPQSLTLHAAARGAVHSPRVDGGLSTADAFRRDHENSKQHKFWRFPARYNPRTRYYTISEYAARSWIAYSNTSREHTRIVYNGIPDHCFNAIPAREDVHAEFGIPSDGRIALCVGRLVTYKAPDTLLHALAPILENENIFLLYLGRADLNVKGTRRMIEQRERRTADASWGHRVIFAGYRKDVPRLMASSHVLVHPARIEGFGLILAEAMTAGLPIVASNVQGIPEVLAGTDSIMVPPDNTDALRDAVLKTLRRTSAEASTAIRKGRDRAENFRMGKRTEAMVELFDDVIADRF